ncbi:DUF3081 family protein [Thalassotalea agarivorans]|uniref:DUF3081 domain-containing protein n=1 Tax=Thalassotalea agarivorans TaxID=349064 RepID=A0A1I0CEE1_THASX|nr:DUF3081 family protein [Thalassotalea agarivorans]SET17425.1 Protein of unknown function [Thalassotalea agarivorans]
MQNSFDLKTCLMAYNKIIDYGEKDGEVYRLNGFSAWSDFDGYHCFIQYRTVLLTLMFHGKYALDYELKDDLTQFEKHLVKFVSH